MEPVTELIGRARGRQLPSLLRAFGAQIGVEVDLRHPLMIHNPQNRFRDLTIGARTHVGKDCLLDLTAPITIGETVTLAMRVTLVTHLDTYYSPLRLSVYPSTRAPIIIEDGAYIGAGATILHGVRIGRCAVVAAGAVVREDVPPYTVVAGVPARVIKHLDPLTTDNWQLVMHFGPRYDSTRQAWQDIWDSASVERELGLLKSKRARQALNIWTEYLPRTGVILEAGSGLSATVITLRHMGFHVIGLDYAINALRVSRRYDATLPLLAGDIHALPHAADSLAGYLSFGVLEHFEHGMMPALAEAFRVLQPGGIMILTIPYPNIIHRFVEWRRKRAGSSVLNDDRFYESTYTREALCANVNNTGFEIIRVAPTSHAYTLWGLGGIFRGEGYYETSPLADALGGVLRVLLPWAFNFSTMVITRKPAASANKRGSYSPSPI